MHLRVRKHGSCAAFTPLASLTEILNQFCLLHLRRNRISLSYISGSTREMHLGRRFFFPAHFNNLADHLASAQTIIYRGEFSFFLSSHLDINSIASSNARDVDNELDLSPIPIPGRFFSTTTITRKPLLQMKTSKPSHPPLCHLSKTWTPCVPPDATTSSFGSSDRSSTR